MNSFLPSPGEYFYRLPIFFFGLSCLVVPTLVTAQTVPQWDRDFGGNLWEELNSVEETADGGYILCGFSSSSQNGDFSGTSNGSGDYWLVKTDSEGIIEWDNNYGGSGLERPWSVQQTTDGGYIIGGYSPSDVGGDKSSPSRGGDDYWIVKVDAAGTLQWDSTYGGDGLDHLYSLIQTNDGGYLLGGRSLSGISGEKTEANKGSWDHWLVKVDANGTLEWDRTLGGSDEEILNMVQEAPDGNYLVGGSSRSVFDGLDINTNLIGVKDFWFLKINALDGSIIWERRYGGTDEDEMFEFVQTQDGGFLLGGGSRSNISPDKSQDAFGIVDMWVIKTDAAGVKEWDQTFGGDNLDNLYSLSQNSVGNFILGGYSGSMPGTGNLASTNKGGWDYLLVYLAEDGTYQWDQTFGGDQNDVLESIFQTSDGGYVLAGHSSTNVNGDKTEPTKGLNDFWMIKTDCSVFVDFADTIVCPNQPVELNAYTGSNCLDCVWTWGDVTAGDSIRVIETPVAGTYSVTLVDGVGCSRSDEISIDIFDTFTVDLGDSTALCDGENTLLDATVPSAVSYEWSTGHTTADLLVDTAAVYAVTVTDVNGCGLEDSIQITVGALPVVNLGNDTTICEDDILFLDAGNPGATYTWTPFFPANQIIPVSGPGAYSVVVNDNGCIGTDEIVISNFDSPVPTNFDLMCNDSNTFYVVTFDINGGDVGSYTVSGDAGNVAGNLFTSAPIPKDQAYSFTIDDVNNCDPVTIEGVYDCECISDAGTLDTNPIVICGNETAIISPTGLPVTDNNDLLLYILHDGSNNVIGNVTDSSEFPEFDFQVGMTYGTTYYVTPVVGNDNGSGGVLMEDGCLSIGEGVALTFFEPPTALITPLTSLSITCDEPALILDGAFSSAPGGTLDFLWEAIDGGNINGATDEPQIELDEPGIYILTVTNQPGGCIDTAMVEILDAEDYPIIDIETPATITCVNDVIQIDASASSNGPDYDIVWSGGTLTGNTSLTPDVDEGGNYTLTITNNTNGCSVAETVNVMINQQPPLIDLSATFSLDCINEEADIVLDLLSVGGFDVVWSTDDGNLEIGMNPLMPTATQAGTYEVEVTWSANGCVSTATTVVSENPDTPTDALYTVIDPSCYGEDDASISIDSVIGGTPGYLYSFDGNPFSSTPLLVGLEAGVYPLTIQDAIGCEWETSVTIIDPQPIIVELVGVPDDGFVELGDSIRLQAFINQPVDTFIWTSPDPLSCYDCLEPWITPLNETFVSIEAINGDGCVGSDRVTIAVRKNRDIYIPTAFSPNGDGVNDYFTVYGGKGIANVNYLRVFDRWGETVFSEEDLPLNFDSEGWNGRFKGKEVNTGVFIYVAEVEFTDGYTEMYTGDVTVVK